MRRRPRRSATRSTRPRANHCCRPARNEERRSWAAGSARSSRATTRTAREPQENRNGRRQTDLSASQPRACAVRRAGPSQAAAFSIGPDDAGENEPDDAENERGENREPAQPGLLRPVRHHETQLAGPAVPARRPALGRARADFEISRQSISRHLEVLEEAGLIVTKRPNRSRETLHFLNRSPMRTAQKLWLEKYTRLQVKVDCF